MTPNIRSGTIDFNTGDSSTGIESFHAPSSYLPICYFSSALFSSVLITACLLIFNRAARSSSWRNMPGVRSTFTLRTGLTTVNLFVKYEETSSPREAFSAISSAVKSLS